MTPKHQLLIGELMATLESLIAYSLSPEVRRQAFTRLQQLKIDHGESIETPPLGNYIVNKKFNQWKTTNLTKTKQK